MTLTVQGVSLPELYAGAMFHHLGLTPEHSSAQERFEVDGSNAARDFLRGHGIPQADVDTVWMAIALHTTARHSTTHASCCRVGYGWRRDGRARPGIKRKPDTTFGNVKADVLADKDPIFNRGNFCSVIRESAWPA